MKRPTKEIEAWMHILGSNIRVRTSQALKFWSKVERRADNECWPWTGRVKRDGYGQAVFANRLIQHAHRVAYALSVGFVARGVCVCHRCDNKLCCNPSHMFLGTYADNNRDRSDKGRTSRRFGSANPSSKLTEEQSDEIKRRAASGERASAIHRSFPQMSYSRVHGIATGLKRKQVSHG